MSRRLWLAIVIATTLGLSMRCRAQTGPHTFPASDTTNQWTGQNTFTDGVVLSNLPNGCLSTTTGLIGSNSSPCGTLTSIVTSSPSGLQGGGSIGSLSLSLLTTCSPSQVLEWNGSSWACATISAGSGTVIEVDTSFPLTGGPITSTGTIGLTTTCSDAQVLEWSAGGSDWVCSSVGTGTVTGSGTSGTIPKWTGTTGLNNSVLSQSSGSITLTNGSSFGNFSTNNGGILGFQSFNDTLSCQSPCYAGKFQNSYSGSTGLGSTPVYGIDVTTNLNAGTTTNLWAGYFSSSSGNGNNTGAITNQYGLQIASVYNGGSGGISVTTNKWLDLNYANQPGISSLKVTNDYGLYIDAVPANPYNNHSGIYIGDQGADNSTSNTWYAINVQPQSGAIPTVVLNMGGVVHYSGSGAPSFTPVSYPAVFWRTDGGTASTVEYICVGTNVWTAVTAP